MVTPPNLPLSREGPLICRVGLVGRAEEEVPTPVSCVVLSLPPNFATSNVDRSCVNKAGQQ
jgi:hypothetical protein